MERVTEATVRRQRVIQTTLLFIILATLPCYCVGFVLLAVAPRNANVGAGTPTVGGTSAATSREATTTLFPSITPYPTLVVSTLSPLQPTPTQFQFAPSPFPSLTPFILPTRTPIIIVPPTITPLPTNTQIIVPTSTPITPSATPITPT